MFVAGFACAHGLNDRPTGPWRPPVLDDLPRCTSDEGAISVGEVAGRTVGERVVVRGRLAREDWTCPMMACADTNGKPSACCNACSTYVALLDPAGAGGRLFLRLEGQRTMFALTAPDCVAALLDESALAHTFIASGVVAEPTDLRVGDAILSDARLCRAADRSGVR